MYDDATLLPPVGEINKRLTLVAQSATSAPDIAQTGPRGPRRRPPRQHAPRAPDCGRPARGGEAMKNERPLPKAGGAVGDAVNHHHSTSPSSEGPDQHKFTQSLRASVIMLAAALLDLTRLLPALKDFLERHGKGTPQVDRFAYRLDEFAAAMGVSRRVLERERAAGRLPRPDLYIGRMPLYRPETIKDWLDGCAKGVNR